jgi:hypothetical protein
MIHFNKFIGSTPAEREAYMFLALQNLALKGAAIIVGAGTAYALTNTSAAVALGTTSPSLTLPGPGTFAIFANLQVDAAAATLTTQTLSAKLRRTNNTAADLTDAAITALPIGAMTTATQNVGIFALGPIIYSTANTDDTIAMYANLSAAAAAGAVNVSAARIIAVQLF